MRRGAGRYTCQIACLTSYFLAVSSGTLAASDNFYGRYSLPVAPGDVEDLCQFAVHLQERTKKSSNEPEGCVAQGEHASTHEQ